MKGISHCIIGVSLTTAGMFAMNPFHSVDNMVAAGMAVIPAAIGSYLVDIDIERSKAGIKLRKALTYAKIAALATLLLWAGCHFGIQQDYPLVTKAMIVTVTVAFAMWVLTKLEHRGPTHSLAVPLAFYLCYTECITGTTPYIDVLFYSFLSGYLLHIAADMLNGKGCPLLWPILSSRYHILDIKYDGIGEKLCCGIAVLAAIGIIAIQFII